jgi:hypothetical protein
MTPEIRERLLEIAEENAESLYSDFGAEGLWVTEDKLPSEPSEFKEKEYEALLSPERLEEIRNGHPPTEAELRRLREERLANILRGNHDAESVPAYCLAEVVDEQEDDDIGSGMIKYRNRSHSLHRDFF